MYEASDISAPAIAIGTTDDDGPFLEPPPKIKRRVRWHLIALFVLTILAGITRFAALDRPTIWYDEASTFRRVCGTFGQMLETIEDDPFDPLFYQGEWLIRQYHPLTPFWLRLIPAVAGTLMIPAMYFLARQVAGRRTALAVALFTLCSAWMINYSRDAKMYMTFWLFVTLTAGCFLWWLRSHTWTAYLAWLAAGCVMMGLNVWGGVILALSPLWMLTARRVHWTMGVGLVLGLAVICSGTVGYHRLFNSWNEKAERAGGLEGIDWVAKRNRGQGAADLVRDSAAALLCKFTFIQEEDGGRPLPPRRVLIGATIAFAAIATLLVIGILPWRRVDSPLPPTSPEPWWRPTLWLGSWLLIAGYVFYCMSMKEPLSPAQWWLAIDDYLAQRPAVFAVVIAILALLLPRLKRVQGVLLALVPVVGLILLAVAFGHVYLAGGPPSLATTVPAVAETVDAWRRPIDAFAYWAGLLLDARFLWTAIVIVVSVAIARSSNSIRGRIWQLVIVAGVVAVLVLLLNGVFVACAGVVAHMKEQGVRPGSIWLPRYMGFIWPALAIAVIALLMRLPGWPVRWLAVLALCGLNAFVGYDRVYGNSEPPLDRIAAEVTASAQPGSTVRTYVQNAEPGGGPGNGAMGNLVGRYYFVNDRTDLSPDTINREFQKSAPHINWFDNAAAIANDIRQMPRVRSVIVWKPVWRQRPTEHDQNILRPADDETDFILKKLGPDWRRVADECVPVRYHWSWSEMYLYRRREYLRVTQVELPKN